MNRKNRREMKKDPILTHEYIKDLKQCFFMIGAEQMFYAIIQTIKETKGIGPKTMDRILEELGKVHPDKHKEVHRDGILERNASENRNA